MLPAGVLASGSCVVLHEGPVLQASCYMSDGAKDETLQLSTAEAAAEDGVYGPLVEVLKSGSEVSKGEAAGALANLAYSERRRSQFKIADAGAIEPLVAVLRSGSEEAKVQAAGALRLLTCNNADTRVEAGEAGAVPPLVELSRTGSAVARDEACAALWSLSLGNVANQMRIARATWLGRR